MKHNSTVILLKMNGFAVSLTTTKEGDTVDTGMSVTLWRTKDTVGDKRKAQRDISIQKISCF